ncbi:MAG: carbon monoxide dehydrogenase subunit G [Ottowia sp.]|nr:carbon monoxide dehydrogenase subunit G [Ottowia sp.]
MDMQGSRPLTVTQQQAWEALNDPSVLKACIPGCERIDSTGGNAYALVKAIRLGPVAARFTGNLQVTGSRAPDSYTLHFDGNGGAAGFGKGSANISLVPQGEVCELAYTVNAQVGGKIAQVGQRLIDRLAKSMADRFFNRFDEEMRRRFGPPEEAARAEPPSGLKKMWSKLTSAGRADAPPSDN